MFKKLFSIFFVLFLFGCSTTNLTGGTSSEMATRVTSSVDTENEVFAVGSAKVESSGVLIAKGKAVSNAKESLKKKIIDEEKIIFSSFLVSTDPYTKKVLESAIPDLMDFSANNLADKSMEKDYWLEGDKVFVVHSISKGEILMESQNTFTIYLDDFINKLSVIKEGVVAPQ